MNSLSLINEKEKKLREIWRLLLVLQFLFSCFVSVAEISTFPSSTFWETISISLTLATLPACLCYVFYYCSYLRYGVGLLTLHLIFSPLFEVASIITHVAIPASNISLAIFFMKSALFIPWYIFSWKLRRINLKLQRKTVIHPQNSLKNL